MTVVHGQFQFVPAVCGIHGMAAPAVHSRQLLSALVCRMVAAVGHHVAFSCSRSCLAAVAPWDPKPFG